MVAVEEVAAGLGKVAVVEGEPFVVAGVRALLLLVGRVLLAATWWMLLIGARDLPEDFAVRGGSRLIWKSV